MPKRKKSALVKQSEKFFLFDEHTSSIPFDPVTSPNYGTPMVVQTFTTYSVCEEPIPDLRKQQQK
jgi:hypothetical protein